MEREQITLKSYAKVNLCLDVVERLENGYHNIDTIMQAIDLYDNVTIKLCKGSKAAESVRINISSESGEIPLNEDNIVYKAARLIEKEYEIQRGESLSKTYGEIEIYIEKNIPVEAGMAGGSGNGAVTLLGLNQMLRTNLTYEKLCSLAKKLGADVPFSLSVQIKGNEEKLPKLAEHGFAAARARGIGEILEPVIPYEGRILISKTKVGISTALVYQGLDMEDLGPRPNVDELVMALEKGDFNKIKENMVNVLEFYVKKRYSNVVYTKHKVQQNIAEGMTLMSGSGPTVFAISQNEVELDRAFAEVKNINEETVLTSTLT